MLPEVAPDFRGAVLDLLGTEQVQGDRWGNRAECSCPKISANAGYAYKAGGFFFMAFPWIFPGGVWCFSGDRPRREGFAFSKRMGGIPCHNDGRLSDDVAIPRVALNMMYDRRSSETCGRRPRNHVEASPANATEMQDKLRAGAYPSLTGSAISGRISARGGLLLGRLVRRC